jgi:PAS domain S-box-containing protein
LLQKELQLRELNISRQELQTILTYTHEGVQLVDAQGIVRYVNHAFTKITGITAKDRIGTSIFQVSPDGALARVLKTKQHVLKWRNKVQNTGVEVISNAAPIYVNDQLIGAIATFQNVTELMQLSQQLQERDDEIKDLHEQLRDVHSARYTFADIIGQSASVQEAITLAKKAAKTGSTVLITGESGTGKELFAHAIHQASSRRHQPFIVVNCAAIPETLLESELFGYEKGAFSQATRKKLGKIEMANGGTLFLDEIGDMSPALQAKLLRVLQTRQFERVGGLHTIEVNVRFIAATNRNLEQRIRDQQFREDLYYRLHVLRLEIPPLRHRLPDLPQLIEVLTKRIGRRIGVGPKRLSAEAAAMLSDYHWPGNIRELENFLERVMNESTTDYIPDSLVYQHLQRLVLPAGSGAAADSAKQRNINPLPETDTVPLKMLERQAIMHALARYGTSVIGKKRAARALGISLATLYNKLKDHRLNEEKGERHADR